MFRHFYRIVEPLPDMAQTYRFATALTREISQSRILKVLSHLGQSLEKMPRLATWKTG